MSTNDALQADPQLLCLSQFNKSVLVVDDIDYMRKQISHILRKVGITNITEADEGGKAFQILRAAPEVYGLVISDLDMNPTNGMHLLHILRKDNITPAPVRNIPFIMLTSDGTQKTVADIRRAGANGVVLKPFTGAILLKSTARVLSPLAS